MARHIPMLGRSVPDLGIGTGGRGREVEEREWLRALRRAFELGILLVDTAEIYSGGFAEEVVGKAIRSWGGPREDLFVVTKIHPSNLASRERMRRSLEASLARLGLGYVDAYLIHWLERDTELREAVKGLEDLWREGLVRHIGVSNFTVDKIEEARSYTSQAEIAVVENRYSLTNRGDEATVIPYCEREGMLYLAYTPIDKGALAANARLAEIGRRYGKTPVQVALNWYTRRATLVPIPRASTVEHVEENAGALGWRLSDEDYRLVDEAFRTG